ncbi:MAG: hypothetical protein AB1649_27725, partial [Chloroflexota bacterium]
GVERNLAFYKEVSNHNDRVIGTIAGSHDKKPTFKLAEIVWPLVQSSLEKQRKEIFGELEKAIGTRQFASGIQSVWQAAQAGRGATLLVEQNFHCPARVDSIGYHLIPASDPKDTGFVDDAVDELIETILSKGGNVVFTKNETLEAHQRVVLILRY